MSDNNKEPVLTEQALCRIYPDAEKALKVMSIERVATYAAIYCFAHPAKEETEDHQALRAWVLAGE